MTNTTLALEQALADFLQALAGKNRSAATSRAYQTDIHQFITWLHENTMVVVSPAHVERVDITEYLATLAARRLSGVSRARKVAALREYFRYLADHDAITKSPLIAIETPKREKNGRTALSHAEQGILTGQGRVIIYGYRKVRNGREISILKADTATYAIELDKLGELPFAERRKLIELLNIEITLDLEDGQKYIDITWYGEGHRLWLGHQDFRTA
jgi:hypothetical protein